MLRQKEFDKLLTESQFEFDPDVGVIDVFDKDDKKAKLLRLIDSLRSRHPSAFSRASGVEFLGQIVDAIDQEDLPRLRSIASTLNKAESNPNASETVKDLAQVVRQIAANVDFNEDIKKSLLVIAESLETKIIVD